MRTRDGEANMLAYNYHRTQCMNQISMDRISFLVTLIHSYSDHKLNVSSDSSKVVGTYVLNIVLNH